MYNKNIGKKLKDRMTSKIATIKTNATKSEFIKGTGGIRISDRGLTILTLLGFIFPLFAFFVQKRTKDILSDKYAPHANVAQINKAQKLNFISSFSLILWFSILFVIAFIFIVIIVSILIPLAIAIFFFFKD